MIGVPMKLSIKRVGFVLLIISFFLLATIYITPLLLPFILGWVLAYLIQPLVIILEQWTKLPRSFSILLSLLFVFSLVAWFLVLLVLIISKEIMSFGQLLPNYITQFTQFLQQLSFFEQLQHYYMQFHIWYGSLHKHTQSELQIQFSDWIASAGDYGVGFLQQFFSLIMRAISSIPSIITVVMISLLSAFFISKDYDRINTWIKTKLPTKLLLIIGKVVLDLKLALMGFIKSHFTLTSITAVITTIGLFILQVDNALMIGLIAGAIDLIPYVGLGAFFIPWIVYLYFSDQFSLVIGLSILYGCIILIRQLIEPRILAKNIGLHPLLTLVALFVGLKLLGIWGMIAGPFILIALQALWRAKLFALVWNYISVKKE